MDSVRENINGNKTLKTINLVFLRCIFQNDYNAQIIFFAFKFYTVPNFFFLF